MIATAPHAERAAPAGASPAYAWYVVVVLMLAYILSFVDRQILSLLVGPIKAEFGVSDTAIGLLQGLAFAAFYTLFGVFVISLAGITLGPLLPGLMTDYGYVDPARIGSALVISIGVSAIFMGACFRLTFASCRADQAAMHR